MRSVGAASLCQIASLGSLLEKRSKSDLKLVAVAVYTIDSETLQLNSLLMEPKFIL